MVGNAIAGDVIKAATAISDRIKASGNKYLYINILSGKLARDVGSYTNKDGKKIVFTKDYPVIFEYELCDMEGQEVPDADLEDFPAVTDLPDDLPF